LPNAFHRHTELAREIGIEQWIESASSEAPDTYGQEKPPEERAPRITAGFVQDRRLDAQMRQRPESQCSAGTRGEQNKLLGLSRRGRQTGVGDR
jgi:hypothetical protein